MIVGGARRGWRGGAGGGDPFESTHVYTGSINFLDQVGGENVPPGPGGEKQQEQPGSVVVRVNEVSGLPPYDHATVQIGGDTPVGLEPNSNSQAATAAAEEVVDLAKGSPVPHPVPGSIEDQPGRTVKDRAILHVTKKQAGAMRARLAEMRQNPRETTYSYLYHNCTSLPEELLRAGGIPAPNDDTPGGLVADLKRRYPQ